jgi:hypothetical protein
LQHIDGASLAGDFARLVSDVPPEADGVVPLTLETSSHPGVFSSTWRMALPGEAFGPSISIEVVVIPHDAAELRAQIQPLLDRAATLSASRFEREWPGTANKIRKMIRAWVTDHQEER